MRYSVRFESRRKRWLVGDCGNDNRTLGEHATKAAAYAQASAEQERWIRHHPADRHVDCLDDILPCSLVVR